MADQSVFGPDVVQKTITGTERIVVGSSASGPKEYTTPNAIAALATAASSATGFTTPQDQGAAGNGSTDDTTAVQAAVNTGKCLFTAFYKITAPIVFPKEARIAGIGHTKCGLLQTPGVDILKMDPSASGGSRGTGAHQFSDFSLLWEIDGLSSSINSSTSFERTDMGGWPIGAAAIAFENRSANQTSGFTQQNSNPSGFYWGYSSLFENIYIGPDTVFTSMTDLGAIGIYVAGQMYACRYRNIRLANKLGFTYAENTAGVHRITGTSGNNFTCASACNYAVGDHVAFHALSNVSVSGFTKRTTMYTVASVSGNNFSVTGVTSPSFSGGTLYAMQDGDNVEEYSPDQNYFSEIDSYTARGGISICCNATTRFENVSIYGADYQVFAAWDRPNSTSNRDTNRGLILENGYFEGPTSTSWLSHSEGNYYHVLIGRDCRTKRWPANVASRNRSGHRPGILIDGKRNVMDVELVFAGVSANSGYPVVDLQGENHKIMGYGRTGITFNNSGTGNDFSSNGSWPTLYLD